MSVDTMYERLDAGGSTILIGDTVASGATIVAALAKYRQSHDLQVPKACLEGRAFGVTLAELIVGGNVALLQSLGSIGLGGDFDHLRAAVTSGVAALEEASSPMS